jgi:hypothetical protein
MYFLISADTVINTVKFLGYCRSSVEFNGVIIHKKAHKYWALRTSLEFSRVYWSDVW